jgi:hypothetical protein
MPLMSDDGVKTSPETNPHSGAKKRRMRGGWMLVRPLVNLLAKRPALFAHAHCLLAQ